MSSTYPHQKQMAHDIFHSFRHENIRFSTLVAPPQWGKTGVVTELIALMTTHLSIHPKNVFVLSGMNDLEWKRQTLSRLPIACHRNVYHRGTTHRFVEHIRDRSNCLVIIDECHIASVSKHRFAKQLAESGIMNWDAMEERNIRLFQTSATPAHTLVDAMGWGALHKTFVAVCPIAYVGFDTLLAEGRVASPVDLCDEEAVQDLLQRIAGRWRQPKYHVFRLSTRQAVQEEENIRQLSKALGFYVLRHNAHHRIENMDAQFAVPPSQHTIVLIKGFYRAAKTFDDTHIGLCHETRGTSKDFNAEVQGLAGRLCGYNKQMGPEAPFVCCKREILEEYVSWFCQRCDYARVHYRSAGLRSRNGVVTTIPSMVHPSLVMPQPDVERGIIPKNEIRMPSNVTYRVVPFTLEQFRSYLGAQEIPRCPKELCAVVWNKFNVPINVISPDVSFFFHYPRVSCGYDVYVEQDRVQVACLCEA